jgi:hypothetical protein
MLGQFAAHLLYAQPCDVPAVQPAELNGSACECFCPPAKPSTRWKVPKLLPYPRYLLLYCTVLFVVLPAGYPAVHQAAGHV